MTLTPGWVLSHVTKVSASRSGKRSTTWWASRSTRIVPYRSPFFQAKSSTPKTWGVGRGKVVARRSRRKRVATGWHREPLHQTRSGSATKDVGDATQALRQTAGASSVLRSHTRESFRKGLARAGRPVAEEAAHLDQQSNGTSLAWQIRKLSCVATMNAAGDLTTIRARHFREGRCNDQGQDMVLDEDVFQKQVGRERKQRGKHGLFLQGERIWTNVVHHYYITSWLLHGKCPRAPLHP